MKHCARCATTKAPSEFGKNAGRSDGLSVYCRVCTREYMATKTYDADRWAANRDAEIERNRVYRQSNHEAEVARSRLKAARRRRESPAKVNATNKARKAAQRRAVPAWADQIQIRTVYEKARELSAAFGVELQVDHVVPLRSKLVCGLHCEANLQLLEKRLNHEKRHWAWPDMP